MLEPAPAIEESVHPVTAFWVSAIRGDTTAPYSEAQFKTLKYRPGVPDRFGSIEDARAFCAEFFAWYNGDHRHSGIAMFTPANVHHGRTDRLLQVGAGVLAGAYAARPERFVKGPPRPESVPAEAWINRPLKEVPQA